MSDADLIRPRSTQRTTQQTVRVAEQRDADAPAPATPVDDSPELHTTVKETVTIADDPQRARVRRTRRAILFTVNLIAILITIRIVLLMLGADPQSAFAAFWYALTGVLTFPFHGLFGPPTVPTYGVFMFEGSSLVAIGIYYLIAWIALRLVGLGQRRLARTRTEITDRETHVEAES